MSKKNSMNSNSSSYSDRPLKSILKKSIGNRTARSRTLSFDEENVRATFHPIDKDYGYDVIDEPDTPFVYPVDETKELDANLLSEKLIKLKAEEEEEEQNEAKRQEFLRKRQEIYHSEFKAAKELASRAEEVDDKDRHKTFRNKRYLMASTEYKTAKNLAKNLDEEEEESSTE